MGCLFWLQCHCVALASVQPPPLTFSRLPLLSQALASQPSLADSRISGGELSRSRVHSIINAPPTTVTTTVPAPPYLVRSSTEGRRAMVRRVKVKAPRC